MTGPKDTPPGRAGAARPARLGVAMLCHENLPLAARMARIWAEGGAAVAIHIDAKAPDEAVRALQADLSDLDILYAPRRACEWGTWSLVAATLDCVTALMAERPALTHVMTVSGSCLPLRPVSELCAFLDRHPGADFIESVTARDVGWTIGGLNEERFTLRFPFSFRRQRRLFDRWVALQRRLGIEREVPAGLSPHLGSQWWCLTIPTLRAILADPRRAEFDRYFQRVWIPDESYFQTLVRRHSIHVESRSLTLAKFDTQGKPYVFYDDHLPLLEASHAFLARKIWPGAAALYDHFPVAPGSPGEEVEPDTDRIEAMLDRAARRRRIGRPGLYMQSRFPRKDAENGKTARPYAVIHGFGDLYPGLAGWLAQGTGLAMQGHLMAADQVEFAGDAPIGPGGLSASAAVRDLDPQGFLTSLIRSSNREVGFLYSPRDRQTLNWFMATDPNARIHVVSGAWIVPLLHSGMPFDDVRRVAAILQRAEIQFLDILDSVWVKARVHRYTLTEVLAQPHAPLRQMLHELAQKGAGDPGLPMPAIHSAAGVAPLLRRLANAGLRPRRMGDLRTLRALTSAPDAARRAGGQGARPRKAAAHPPEPANGPDPRSLDRVPAPVEGANGPVPVTPPGARGRSAPTPSAPLPPATGGAGAPPARPVRPRRPVLPAADAAPRPADRPDAS